MGKAWVIGDIHGCYRTLRRLVERIHFSKEDTLYLLGDYVSRGPDSKGVIDYVWQLQREGYHVVGLMGNHEEMLLNARTDEDEAQRLLRHGGQQTLLSFGVADLADIPPPYFDWIEQLPSLLILENYVLVHAGLNFELLNPFADEQAMRWIRDSPVNPKLIGYRVLVHGHTPVALGSIRNRLKQESITEINLDGGCVYSEREGQGHLVAFELESRKLVVQRNVEEMPI